MTDFPKIRGISRMTYARTSPGWFARYTREGVTFSKHFSDKEFGSAEASLQAAKDWHTKARELFPPMDRREYANLQKGHNKSGIVGVYRTTGVTKGHRYAYWVGSWTPWKGKKGMKSFAVGKYGEEGAKQMAIAARDEALRKLEAEWPEEYWEYRRRLDGQALQQSGNPSDKRSDIFGFEGELSYRSHIARERDSRLRDAKLDQFIEQNGRLFCEICKFDFEATYNELGKEIIEIHHTFPVGKMEENHKTRIEDLMCVCANCHLVLHNGDPYINLQKLMFLFDSKKIKRTMRSTERLPASCSVLVPLRSTGTDHATASRR
jgi:hypothetical protein